MKDFDSSFEIHSSCGGWIERQPGIPEKFKKDKLCASIAEHAIHGDNTMLFQQLHGEEFVCFDSRYRNETNSDVRGIVNQSLLELRISYRKQFSSTGKDKAMDSLLAGQYELCFSKGADNKSKFVKNVHIHTVDFHIRREYLYQYASRYKQLGLFLDKVDQDKSASLGNPSLFLSPGMISSISDIMHYDGGPQEASTYYEGSFLKLISLVFSRLSPDDTMKKQRFSNDEIDRVIELTAQLRRTDKRLPTVKNLAQSVGMTICKFQDCIKKIYGKPFYTYMKEITLLNARERIYDTKYKLRSIGIDAGYADLQNFSKAFAEYFGHAPSTLRKEEEGSNE